MTDDTKKIEEFADSDKLKLEIELESNISSEEDIEKNNSDIDINEIKRNLEDIEDIEKIEIVPIMDVDQIFASTKDGMISLGVLGIKCELLLSKNELKKSIKLIESAISTYYNELQEDIEYDGKIELTGIHRINGTKTLEKFTKSIDFVQEYISVEYKRSDKFVLKLNRGKEDNIILEGRGNISLEKAEGGSGAENVIQNLVEEYNSALEDIRNV